jgi:hypothetical protein
MASVVFFFTQQQEQDSIVVAGYQDVLGSNLKKPRNNTKTKNKSVSIINPLVINKQNEQFKFKEEIKKILKKALISAHENSKNEVNELIKKNEQLDVLPWYLMVACGLESHKLIPISSNTSFAEVDSFIFCFLLSSNEPILLNIVS